MIAYPDGIHRRSPHTIEICHHQASLYADLNMACGHCPLNEPCIKRCPAPAEVGLHNRWIDGINAAADKLTLGAD